LPTTTAHFQKLGVEVYGVSTDTHFTHKAWHDASETIEKVQYPLVGDPTGTLARNFDVMIEEEGLALRGTFVINPEGQIRSLKFIDLGIGRDGIGTAAQGQGSTVRRRIRAKRASQVDRRERRP
jgi:alkyl hydroperoxide reductase subunit AhpC